MQNKIDRVDWVGIFPSLKLAKTGREALQPARMGLALLWVGGMVAGLMMAEKSGLVWLPSPDEAPKDDRTAQIWLVSWGLLWGGLGQMLFASAISRFAAVKVATGYSVRLREVKTFLAARMISLLAGLLFLFLPLLVLGGIGGTIDFFTHWHGVEILVVVLFLAASVVILPASMLFLPAISVDGNDGFDAPGRAVSYVLARPWALALHLGVLAFFAAVCIGIPCVVVYGALWITFGLPVPAWLYVVLFLPILAYAFSFFVTGLTRIYFLIRESADGVPETEIWNPSDDQRVTMGVEEDQARG